MYFDIPSTYLLFNVLTIENFLERYALKISSKHIIMSEHIQTWKYVSPRILTSEVRHIYIKNKKMSIKNIDIKNRVKIELIKKTVTESRVQK